MSKKPLIGAQYIIERAREYVRHDLMPSTFEYVVPGGKPGKTYMLTGASRRLFLETITEGYRAKGKEINPEKLSEWVAKSYQKQLVAEHQQMWDALPDEEKTQHIIGEVEHKRPSQKAVMRAILGCEPDAAPDMDWAAIHKRWKYGTAKQQSAGSTPQFSYDKRRAYAQAASLKKVAHKKATASRGNAPPAYALSVYHSASASYPGRYANGCRKS
jgi:hypothetical protein